MTILIDPLDVKGGPPVTPLYDLNRINEAEVQRLLGFLDIQQIELINKLCKNGLLKGTKYKEKCLHSDQERRVNGGDWRYLEDLDVPRLPARIARHRKEYGEAVD